MAVREFHIGLFNETPFKLTKVEGHCDHGTMTKDAPAEIGPTGSASSVGTWDTESEGWWRGVEGAVWYRIQDGDESFGADRHKGRRQCLYIYWSNPYIWGPSTRPFVKNIGGCPTPPGPAELVEAPFDEATPVDKGSDYGLFVRTTINSPGEGEVWTEMLSGYFTILPHIAGLFNGGQHQHVTLALRQKTRVSSAIVHDPGGFAGDLSVSEAPPRHLRPRIGESIDAWVGRWEETAVGAPRILVDIVPTTGLASDGLSVKITDKTAAITVQKDLLIPEPIVVIGYSKDLLPESDAAPSPGIGIVTAGKRTGAIDHPAAGIITAGADAIATTVIAADPLPTHVTDANAAGAVSGVLTDTITLPNAVELQLYGEIRPDKQVNNYRVRYLRAAADGTPVVDVMLQARKTIA